MQVTIYPSAIAGAVSSNPSKSHAQRAVAIAALAAGRSTLMGVGTSDDVRHAIGVAKAMGADVSGDETALTVLGGRPLTNSTWHCGESALCLRMFAAIAPLFAQRILLTAEGSLMRRPMDFIEDGLHRLGVSVESNSTIPSLAITGPYRNDSAVLDGGVSSQFQSGLLIALPLVHHDTHLAVHDLVSRPYIDMTLSVMRAFGVSIEQSGNIDFHISGNCQYVPTELAIEGDWSGMANLMVCAAMGGHVKINGLTFPSTQGDSGLIQILADCGAYITTVPALTVKNGELNPFEYDGTDTPDLIPPLVALAAACQGTSRIRGVSRLRAKESDRAAALVREFTKLNGRIRIEGDALIIDGGTLNGATVDVYQDHRIAMALAVAAVHADGPVTITGAECVRKSYPGFFHDLESLGVRIEYIQSS